MGFDSDRFEGQVTDDLKCSICSGVFEDPVQGSRCQHIFCRECITQWLHQRPVCPIDMKPLTESDLSDVPRIVGSLLSGLSIACDFAGKGCGAYVKLDLLSGHLTRCEFNPEALVTCSNGCGHEIKRCAVPSHECLIHLLDVVEQMDINRHRLEMEVKDKDKAVKQLEKERNEKQKVKSQMEKEKVTHNVVVVGLKAKIAEMEKERQATQRNVKLLDELKANHDALRLENDLLRKLVAHQGVQTTGDKPGAQPKEKPGPSQAAVGSKPQAAAGKKAKAVPLPTSAEHRQLIKELKQEGFIVDKVFKTMIAIDFCTIFDDNPYDKRIAEAIAQHLELWSRYVQKGSNVLHVMRDWEYYEHLAPYELVALANWVESSGEVFSISATRLKEQIDKHHGHLFQGKRLKLLQLADGQQKPCLKLNAFDFLYVHSFAEATDLVENLKLNAIVNVEKSRKWFFKNASGVLEKLGAD